MRWWRVSFLWVALLLASSLVAGVAAQDATSPLSVVRLAPDFPGSVRLGRLTPFPLVLSSQKEFRGELVLRSDPYDRPGTEHRLEVTLPPATPLAFWPTFVPRGDRLAVELLSEGGSRIWSGSFQLTLSQDRVHILAVGDVEAVRASTGKLTRSSRVGSSLWGDQHWQVSAAISMAGLAARDLPRNWIHLEAVDVVVMAGCDLSLIGAEETAALERWVRAGGHLVVSRPLSLLGSPLPAAWSLLPARIAGSAEVSSLAPLVVAVSGDAAAAASVDSPTRVSRVEPHGEVLARADGLPLAVSGLCGLGRTTLLSFDMTSPPFRGSAGAATLFGNLLEPGTRLLFDPSIGDYWIPQVLSTFSPYRTPAFPVIALILGSYLLCVGPLQIFLLSRIRRMELSAVTTPVLSLLFIVGIYGTGFLVKGTSTSLCSLDIVFASEEGTHRVESFMSLFSAGVRRYDVAPFLDGGATHLYNPASVADGSEQSARIALGKSIAVEDAQTRMWSSRLLRGLVTNLDRGPSVRVTRVDGEYDLTIEDAPGKSLQVLVLDSDGKTTSFVPGDETGVYLRAARVSPDTRIGPQTLLGDASGADRVSNNLRGMGGDGTDRGIEILVNGPFGWRPRGLNVVLVAAVFDAPTVPVLLDGKKTIPTGRTLLLAEVEVEP